MKRLIYSLMVLMCLTACDKVDLDDIEADGTMPSIMFTTFTSSLTDYDDTRATLADAKCATLDFAMFTADGTLYRSIQQTKTDTGFGTISLDEIPYGEYTIVVVGNAGDVHASIYSNSLVDFGGKVYDTFCRYMTLSVNKSTSAQQQIELRRITSKLTIKTTDAVPAKVRTVEIQSTGGCTSFNPQTGLASSSAITSRTISADVSSVAGKTLTYSLLTFLPKEECNISAVVSAKDAEGTTLYSASIPSARMKVNCQTVYSGRLFVDPSVSASASITVNADWADTFSYTF